MESSSPAAERKNEIRRDAAWLLSLVAAALPGSYLLLTSTVTLVPGYWPYDIKRMLQFGLLLFLFLLPLCNPRIREQTAAVMAAVPRWFRIGTMAIIAWGVVSALHNSRSVLHAANSLSEVALLLSLGLAVLVIAACRQLAAGAFERLAVALLAMTALAVGMQELLGVLAAKSAGVDFNFRISLLHFSWPRFYNQVQSWIVPVLAALPLLFGRYRLAAFFCLLALGLQWYIVLVTGARGSLVALSAAFVFAFLLLPAARRPLIRWQGGGLLLGLLIFAAVLYVFESDAQHSPSSAKPAPSATIRDADREADGGRLAGGDSSFFHQSIGRPMAHTSGRTWMWPIAVNDIRQNPVLGIGPMNYACTSEAGFGHPHNFALQLAAEWGLPAALLTALLFVLVLIKATAQARQASPGGPADEQLHSLLLTGLVAASLHAGLSGVMVMPASQVAGLLVAGMLLGLQPPSRGTRTSPSLRWSFLPGLALCSALVALGVHELRTMEARAESLSPGQSLYPRIWQDSKVCSAYTVKKDVIN